MRNRLVCILVSQRLHQLYCTFPVYRLFSALLIQDVLMTKLPTDKKCQLKGKFTNGENPQEKPSIYNPVYLDDYWPVSSYKSLDYSVSQPLVALGIWRWSRLQNPHVVIMLRLRRKWSSGTKFRSGACNFTKCPAPHTHSPSCAIWCIAFCITC